jgi:DNA-binding transcriptional MerR regulator
MSARTKTSARERLLTIGTVTRRLTEEFPDISISKIRYLEDQGLLAPRRTQGGYRLFSEEDVERLETILRLQRDEFLPLRVIREQLSSPGAPKGAKRRHATRPGITRPEDDVDLGELCERAGVTPAVARELEEFGLLAPRNDNGTKLYGEGDVDVAAACAKLSRYGISARHLRTFRTAADREAGLLEQILAPALRSRNPERRAAALDELQSLAELAQELSQLLFWRDLKQLAER